MKIADLGKAIEVIDPSALLDLTWIMNLRPQEREPSNSAALCHLAAKCVLECLS